MAKGRLLAVAGAAIGLVTAAVLSLPAADRPPSTAPSASASPLRGVAEPGPAVAPPAGSNVRTIPGDDTDIWKVPVYPDDPIKGAADAVVTVVAFSEFESPFCKRAAETLEQLLAAYPSEL